MRIHSRYRGQSGFSLIEVMIAVIVLATGLLALAALQINLTSSSADAKARSRIASLLVSAIDDERAAGFSGIACFGLSGCTPATPVGCVTTGTTLQKAICTAQTDAGVTGLTMTQTSTEYFGLVGGNFTNSTPVCTNPPAPVACSAIGSTIYGDYKLIQLSANWTDATGGARTLATTTIASDLALTASGALRQKPLTTFGSMSPTVHETNPSSTPGVIPVAVGNGSSSASTNPKPTLGNVLPSTTFNTLNYNTGGLNGALSATIQKRVETTVAECVCQGSSGVPPVLQGDVFLGATTYRPTYWNGLQYSVPVDAKIAPYSAQYETSHGNSYTPVVPQNDLCTICCRDHHDATSDVVKYDPVTGDLNRYQATTSPKVTLTLDASNHPIVANVHGDIYLDACRIIRVDGLQRVAADIQSKQMGLIATAPKGFATTSVPDSSVAANYEQFVLDYLNQELTSVLAGGGDVNADTIFNNPTYDLNSPATINATTISGDYRYVNGRGLYLDHLEQAAIDQINSVKSTCAAGTFPTCVLAFVPFSTIDVTQLEGWLPLPASDPTKTGSINLTATSTSNTASACTTTGTQIRGCVTGISSGNDKAVATMRRSNSAVAASVPISPYDMDLNPTTLVAEVHSQTDAQAFKIGTTNTASEFFVALTGPSTTIGTNPNTISIPFPTLDLSTTNDPTVFWGTSGSNDFCFANVSRTDTDPDPYDCVTPIPLALPLTVTVGNYNEVVNQAVSNPCNNQDTATYNQPTLICYSVTGATVTGAAGYTATVGTVTGSKTTGEQTLVNITGAPTPIPKSAATVNVTFGANGNVTGTFTCDAVTNVPTFTTPTSCP